MTIAIIIPLPDTWVAMAILTKIPVPTIDPSLAPS